MISVIIPHLNDPGLEACLLSLDAQEGYSGAWEILVVDNGSVEPPQALCDRFERVRLLHEPLQGPGPARNKGVAEAKGEILAFTDADCRVAANWLTEIAAGMSDPSTTVLGGAVNVAYDNPQHPRFTEPYERVYSFRNDEHIAQGYSASANMAVRAEVFDKTGGFGGRDIAEDQEWGLRASRMGNPPKYRASMIVHNSSRKDFAALKRKWTRHIIHDYNAMTSSKAWIFRALSLVASPLLELQLVITSPKISGLKERFLCFCCLCCVRAYRSWTMIAIMLRGEMEIQWNDPGETEHRS